MIAAGLLEGVVPVAPTPFHDDGALDPDGMRRVLDCMVAQGNDGICVLANYSEQFLLSDEERALIARLSLEHVAGRVPVVVTCSHFSTRVAAARARDAAALGAAMVMLMPPYHGTGLRAGAAEILDHFAAVAEAGLPIMVQDSPLSGVELSAPFLVELARKVPLVTHFKIEVPQSAAKLRALIALGGDAVAGPLDGEEGITLLADLDAGARGTMTSAMIPDLVRAVVDGHHAGRREAAMAAYARILPAINHENRQCGLRAAKIAFREGGVIRSEAVRHPLTPVHPDTRVQLLELLRPLDPVALRWGR